MTAAVARRVPRWFEPALLAVTSILLLAGVVAWLLDRQDVADGCWAAGTGVAVLPAVAWIVAALRHGRAGVDVVAVLSLVGTLAVREYLAGSLIAVMLATGRTLDAAAERRASRDLRALLERAPRTARRRVGDGVQVVALAEVAPGDLLIVAPGEVVPVDGVAEGGLAVLDESALTGEALETEVADGGRVRSGVVNAGSAFELRAAVTAEESTYAGLVRLAREAGAQSAPVVRLADRYAAWFLPLTLLTAGLAWAVSGSAVRAVAVLVVATPCPLLLAAPVAIVSGLSRASRRGVIIRGGGALENLGNARTMVLDKTGTLTVGRPAVVEVTAAPGEDPAEVLRLCASADQVSPHVLAQAITAEARPGACRSSCRATSSRSPAAVSVRPSRAGASRWANGRPPSPRSRRGPGRCSTVPCWTAPRSPGWRSRAGWRARCCCATRCASTHPGRSDGCVQRVCAAW
jgi:cation transport ATPase